MNTNSASKKAISMVCLIAGIILLAAALIQDISGSGAGWRGPALIIGAIGILLGMYLFPTLKHHRSIVNFIFVFPLLFTFVVTVIIPLCLGVFYSFTDWNGIKMTGFIGFANYKAMFSEPSFLWSLIITILFVVLNMVLVNVVAFMLALLCTSKIKGLSFFRASYFLPNLFGNRGCICQCSRISAGLPGNERNQGTELLPGRLLHSEPDRRYRTWLCMAVRI